MTPPELFIFSIYEVTLKHNHCFNNRFLKLSYDLEGTDPVNFHLNNNVLAKEVKRECKSCHTGFSLKWNLTIFI